MSRNEYLQTVEEGFIKDTVKKGWEKIKSFFKLGFKKVKDFLAVVDGNGNVLPVVSFQATIDRIADLTGVEVYAPSLISDLAVEAGGRGCEEKASLKEDEEIYNYGPNGRREYVEWLKDGKYKDEPEYKNLLTMTSTLAEQAGVPKENLQKIFEDWEGIKKARVKLIDDEELQGISPILSDEFSEILNKKIKEWSVRRGKDRVQIVNGRKRVGKVMGNILVFGAPGIGKSTVPNAVVKEYNSRLNSQEDMISIININCANLKAGDFMMPTMPREVNITDEIENFKDAFPQANAALAELNPEQKKQIANVMYHSQIKATDAPKSWLPSYRRTGNDFIDGLLNDAANGGVYDNDGHSVKTGGGGIILFDEFLRCDPDVFGELMNFLNDRQLNGWVLGDRWTIIACSNRPQDDGQVAEVWGSWYGAARDRWDKIFQLIPTPEEWKEWAREKGCDELLLDFIFDKEGMSGDEYANWHSMVTNGAGASHQAKPVTPRQWERVFTQFTDYEIDHDYTDISEMSEKEIYDELKGSFGEEFIRELTEWLKDHMEKIDLDGIMNDPRSVYMPQKFVNDPEASLVLIQRLYTEFESRYKDDPTGCSDDKLANIFIWLGMNYKDDYVTVYGFADKLIKSIYKDGTDNKFNKYIKAEQALMAAFPLHDLEDEVKEAEEDEEEDCRWPEGSLEIIKNLMREYFPWRIDGDEVRYFDDFDMDEVEELSKKIKDDQKPESEE